MNERDIELALQAGLGKPYVSKTRCTSGVKLNDVDALQRFANLIRADERERIKVANAPEIDRINTHIKNLEDAVKNEREDCAKTVETIETYEKIEKACFKFAAKTIRARGNT